MFCIDSLHGSDGLSGEYQHTLTEPGSSVCSESGSTAGARLTGAAACINSQSGRFPHPEKSAQSRCTSQLKVMLINLSNITQTCLHPHVFQMCRYRNLQQRFNRNTSHLYIYRRSSSGPTVQPLAARQRNFLFGINDAAGNIQGSMTSSRQFLDLINV